MQENVTFFTSLGVVGVIGYKLFETFLKDREDSKKEMREQREDYIREMEANREMYKQELDKDRETYTNSINSVVDGMKDIAGRMTLVENDVREIKDKMNK